MFSENKVSKFTRLKKFLLGWRRNPFILSIGISLGACWSTGLVAFLRTPKPYTKALLAAVPLPNPNLGWPRVHLPEEVSSAQKELVGCAFHPRCRKTFTICHQVIRGLRESIRGHHVAHYLCSTG